MKRSSTIYLFWGLLVVTGILLILLNACGGGSSPAVSPVVPPPSSQVIQHVVLIVQENRSPDNLFHDTNLMAAGADIATTGMNSLGQTITLEPGPLATIYDNDHSHKAFLEMYDDGKMDGANKILETCSPQEPNCTIPPNPQFAYVTPSDVTPYFQMAETYTFADHMFQNNQGPSFPAHQFILSGTSAPSLGSDLFAAEEPLGVTNPQLHSGCVSPPQVMVELINPQGVESPTRPCFEHPTLTDLLNGAGLSWRWYAPTPGTVWAAPNAIKHMCVPNAAQTECTGSDWVSHVTIEAPPTLNKAQVLADIAAGNLAAVTWVMPDGEYSDHPTENNGSGPSWVGDLVNAIGTSKFWSSTVIFIFWDDWGGWYDHVPPPAILNSYEDGFRVPLIVMSPYAKAAYISHQTHTFGSILKFIENNFGLPNISPGYVDNTDDDLSDCFDFSQTPVAFHAFRTKFDAKHFLDDTSPAKPPDDDD